MLGNVCPKFGGAVRPRDKRATIPSERRRLLDFDSLRNGIEAGHTISKWVKTKQMLADCLAKEDQRTGEYLCFVRKSARYHLMVGIMADHRIMIAESGSSRHALKTDFPPKPRLEAVSHVICFPAQWVRAKETCVKHEIDANSTLRCRGWQRD